ncbi:MAG: winged helix-turn-helix domain-containing protein [Myxococcota bacterium]|nr:winged helix-turn-helix domain-containing protein [Myxococcota bacterium]
MLSATNSTVSDGVSARLRLTVCTIDLTRREVVRDGAVVRLTSLETRLLTFLTERRMQVVSREDLLQSVWGYHPGVVSRAVDNTVRRLRQKIEQNAKEPDHLLSAYGSGYRLEYDHQGLEKSQQSMLIGRGALLQEAVDLLQSETSVTLVGPGGVGKTALARTIQAQAQDVRAVFCDMRAARSTPDLLRTLASVLDLPGQAHDNIAALYQRVLHQLAHVPTLLILDNLEQVLTPATALCTTLVAEVASLQLLTTSRHRLSHPGEHVLRVPPLTESAARKLFSLRARAAGSTVDDPALEMLVERLDGLPLAIELAAARASIMSPGQMLEHLYARFQLLRSGEVALQSTIQWSWDLLGAEEQAGLLRLSTFEAPFRLEAAAAVLGSADPFDALNTLSSLREHSLLDHAGSHYSMLESIRDFVRPLTTTADYAPHIDWMDRHGQQLLGRRHSAADRESLRELVYTMPDHRAALRRMGSDEPAKMLRLAMVISGVLSVHGPIEDRLALWQDVTARLQHASPAQQAEALGQLADCLRLTNRLDEALSHVESAINMGDLTPELKARLLMVYGVNLMTLGRMPEAGARLMEALALIPAETWSWDHFITVFNLGSWNIFQLNHTQAEELYLRAQALARGRGARMAEAFASSALGSIYLQTGNLKRAERTLIEALAVQEDLGDFRSEASTRCNLAALWIETGRIDDATEALERTIADGRRLGENRLEGLFTANLALAFIVSGRLLEAADHIDRAIGLHSISSTNRSVAWLLVFRGLVRALNDRHESSEHAFSEAHQRFIEQGEETGLVLLELSRCLARLHAAPTPAHISTSRALIASSTRTAARKSMDVRIVSKLLTRALDLLQATAEAPSVP